MNDVLVSNGYVKTGRRGRPRKVDASRYPCGRAKPETAGRAVRRERIVDAVPLPVLAEAKAVMLDGMIAAPAPVEAAILLTREAAARIVEEQGHRMKSDHIAMLIRNIDLGLRSE